MFLNSLGFLFLFFLDKVLNNHSTKYKFKKFSSRGDDLSEKSFNIAVTNENEEPTDIVSSTLTISENAGANAIVGSLSTIDADLGDTFSYSLVSGVGDADNTMLPVPVTALLRVTPP